MGCSPAGTPPGPSAMAGARARARARPRPPGQRTHRERARRATAVAAIGPDLIASAAPSPVRYRRAMRLTGKVVLITNVGQYMGPACAEEFAKEGAILALHDRTEARAQAALELARAYGREASVVTGDLTVSGDANRVVRTVAERHGRLDVLVNNSSHAPVGGPVDEVSAEP